MVPTARLTLPTVLHLHILLQYGSRPCFQERTHAGIKKHKMF